METITVDNNVYELIRNEKDGFNASAFVERYTDYFQDFDYIVGDWSYSKLRLKGFKNPQRAEEHNNIDNVEKYITLYCAYGCKWFILKKV